MINGAHTIIYSQNSEADRAFFGDILGFKSIDAGHGWLIFSLPPAEVAFHPAEANGKHELYFMCDDVRAEIVSLESKGIVCSPIREERWGTLTAVSLPGGGTIGLYQPKHPKAIS